jgi:hypothetical protein
MDGYCRVDGVSGTEVGDEEEIEFVREHVEGKCLTVQTTRLRMSLT